MSTDVQQEWRELEETYAQMSNEELTDLAAQGYELTDVAREALQAQLVSRGVKTKVADAAPPVEENDSEPQADLDPADLDLVDLVKVWSAEEARVYKKLFDEAGMPAYLGPENIDRVEDFHRSYEKGVYFRVRSLDQQRAISGLKDFIPPGRDQEPEIHEAEACNIGCPKCHSSDVLFLELEASAAKPGEDARFHWHCDACGYDWEDDGIEKDRASTQT